MSRTKTATELAEQIAALAEQLRPAAIAEARQYLAERLAGMAAGTEAADQEIRDCFQGGQDMPADYKISQDFRDGLAFAAELIADRDFDF